jgi:hypothetical protein
MLVSLLDIPKLGIRVQSQSRTDIAFRGQAYRFSPWQLGAPVESMELDSADQEIRVRSAIATPAGPTVLDAAIADRGLLGYFVEIHLFEVPTPEFDKAAPPPVLVESMRQDSFRRAVIESVAAEPDLVLTLSTAHQPLREWTG